MCNLYSQTKGQQAILEFTRAARDATGNLPMQPGIYPDYSAPIVRNGPDGERELAMARWGMPSSQFALMQATKKRAAKLEAKGEKVDFNQLLRMEPDGATNIRNIESTTGSAGWESRIAVSCRSRRLASSTSRLAEISGSRSMKADRSHSSPASTPRTGHRCARSRKARRQTISTDF
jgi:hypothetical protein